jgi:hypothetical protein
MTNDICCSIIDQLSKQKLSWKFIQEYNNRIESSLRNHLSDTLSSFDTLIGRPVYPQNAEFRILHKTMDISRDLSIIYAAVGGIITYELYKKYKKYLK